MAAQGSGWCLIWSDNRDRWEIQRDDEMQTFSTDDEALTHVATLAAAGDATARSALSYTRL